MNSVISYTLEKCIKCLKCIKVCPIGAISVREERVRIDKEKCINCGNCVDACAHQGLQAKGSTLVDLENYDYCVALIPTSVFGDCSNQVEVETLVAAIEKLGFDLVVDLSEYDGALYQEQLEYIKVNKKDSYLLSSFCPVINQWVEQKYPMLLGNLIPLQSSSELAAKEIRKQLKDTYENIGIFLLCDCIAKLPFAKFPYGTSEYEVDHAVALADIFPQISRRRNKNQRELKLCSEGLRFINSNQFLREQEEHQALIADGQRKVQLALEMLEFGQIRKGEFAYLSNCINGCIGGNLLWGNPFDKAINLENLIDSATVKPKIVSKQDLYTESPVLKMKDTRSLQERMMEYEKLNEQLELLPGFDCGACGYPSCRIMAEEIVAGNATMQECKLLKTRRVSYDSKRDD